MTQIICPVCWNNEQNTSFFAKERLIGTREKFHYGECYSCGTVFLLDQIKDFAPYYPKQYHCFDDEHYPSWKKFLLNSIYQYNFWWIWILWSLVSKVFTWLHWYHPEQNIRRISHASHIINTSLNSHSIKKISVLDLWCWSWSLLKQLQSVWFTSLTWVEPYWEPSTHKWIQFIKSNIIDYIKNSNEEYDIIVLSHVLEHLYNHEEIIKHLKKLLKRDWIIIIAMPFIWKLFNKYRENRLSLDAPRHTIIHSIWSLTALIEKSSLNVHDIRFEQKWRDIFASEMYSRDIWFSEITGLGIKDTEFHKHKQIADTYNKQKQWWSSVTFFITHQFND